MVIPVNPGDVTAEKRYAPAAVPGLIGQAHLL